MQNKQNEQSIKRNLNLMVEYQNVILVMGQRIVEGMAVFR